MIARQKDYIAAEKINIQLKQRQSEEKKREEKLAYERAQLELKEKELFKIVPKK